MHTVEAAIKQKKFIGVLLPLKMSEDISQTRGIKKLMEDINIKAISSELELNSFLATKTTLFN